MRRGITTRVVQVYLALTLEKSKCDRLAPAHRRSSSSPVWALGSFSVLQLACATVYEPAGERLAASEKGVSADIKAIVGRKAILAVEAKAPATIAVPRLASLSERPCESRIQLSWWRGTEGWDLRSNSVEVAGVRQLAVHLGSHRNLLRNGLVVDLPLHTEAGEACLRIPLTGMHNEILWRATAERWDGGMSIRADYPSTSLGGVGPSLIMEGRVVHPIDAWRPAFGLNFGPAVCRENCRLPTDTYESIAYLFIHLGTVLGVDYRIPVEGWALDVGPSLSASVNLLAGNGYGNGYGGSRAESELAARLSLRIVIPGRSVPGFSPRDGAASGPELTVERRIGFGRGSGQSGFAVAAGWSWSFEGPL